MKIQKRPEKYVPDRKLRENRQISRLYEQTKRDIIREENRIRRTLKFHGFDHEFPKGAWSKKQYLKVNEILEKINIAPAIKFTFEMYLNKLTHLWEIQKQLLKELNVLAKSESYQRSVELLKSAPGIGILTAIRLVLEWGDLERFHRKEKFSSFLGLIPSEYSSGMQEHKGHITARK